jgi:hypothetical protein
VHSKEGMKIVRHAKEDRRAQIGRTMAEDVKVACRYKGRKITHEQ